MAALGALVVIGSACADSEVGGPTAATITILPQSYQTRPGPTSAGQTTTLAPVDGRAPQEQDYVLESGEYPYDVADKFDISLDALLEYNDWELDNGMVPDWPAAGETVKIPPNALIPTTEPSDGGSTTTTVDNTVNPRPNSSSTSLGDECTPGSYTVEEGDYPIDVANDFDVSIDALNQANADTTGYSSFFPGLEIVIPPAEGC